MGILGIAALAGIITYLEAEVIDNMMYKDVYDDNIDVNEPDGYKLLPNEDPKEKQKT